MMPEIARFRELRGLIRASHAELAVLLVHLTEAHQRELDPVDLGVRIADIGRQISVWKSEQMLLFRRIAWDDATHSASPELCCLTLNRLNMTREYQYKQTQAENQSNAFSP